MEEGKYRKCDDMPEKDSKKEDPKGKHTKQNYFWMVARYKNKTKTFRGLLSGTGSVMLKSSFSTFYTLHIVSN